MLKPHTQIQFMTEDAIPLFLNDIRVDFSFPDMWIFADPSDPLLFLYLPLHIDTARGENGNILSSLIPMGTLGFAMLSTEWRISSARMEAVRLVLATQTGQAMAAIKLRHYPVTVSQVCIQIQGNDGAFIDFSCRKSSGHVPYSAVFSLTLKDAELLQVQAAFAGDTDALRAVYHTELAVPVSVEFELTGNFSEVETEADLARVIERGMVRVAGAASINNDEIAMLAMPVFAALASGSRDELTLKISKTDTRPIHLQITTDIAAWFQSDDTDFANPQAITTASMQNEGDRSAKIFSLDPSTHADQIAFIELEAEDDRAILSPPHFAPVTLVSGSEIRVRTHYNSGAPAFETLIKDGRRSLAAQDIGLLQICVDAEMLHSEGVTDARATFFYRPENFGIEETRSISFTDFSSPQHLNFVARGAAFENALTYELRGVAADGTAILLRNQTANSQNLTLSSQTKEDRTHDCH